MWHIFRLRSSQALWKMFSYTAHTWAIELKWLFELYLKELVQVACTTPEISVRFSVQAGAICSCKYLVFFFNVWIVMFIDMLVLFLLTCFKLIMLNRTYFTIMGVDTGRREWRVPGAVVYSLFTGITAKRIRITVAEGLSCPRLRWSKSTIGLIRYVFTRW